MVNWVQDAGALFLFSLQGCAYCPCFFPFLLTWVGQIFPCYLIEKMITVFLLVFSPVLNMGSDSSVSLTLLTLVSVQWAPLEGACRAKLRK